MQVKENFKEHLQNRTTDVPGMSHLNNYKRVRKAIDHILKLGSALRPQF